MNVSGNTSATTIDLSSLPIAGGDVNVTGNGSATLVDLSSLETAGGNVNVTANGSCTTVLLPELDSVTGNATVESCGTGTFSLTGTSTGGYLSLSTSGYAITTGTTAEASTMVSTATSEAVMTVQLEADTFTTPVNFSVTRLDAPALAIQGGVDATGDAVLVDPLVAYEITFGVPTLNRDATLSFDINVAALDEATLTAFLAALESGGVTLATSQDGGSYQTFPLCADEAPAAGGCVLVERLDATGQPTTGTPSMVRFSNVVGHFSRWAVAFVSAAPDDTTPPSITADVAGAAGQNGWYVGDVTVTWTVTDDESPVTSPSCGSASVTSDTAGVTLTCTATSAGGTSSSSVTITLDKTPPAITLSAPAGPYLLGQAVTASYACSDAGSGLASCTAPLASGATVETAAVGPYSFGVHASDHAGNSAGASSTYQVRYQPAGTACLGEPGHQILAPIRSDGTSLFAKNGTVPAKFRVCDASGRPIGTPGVVTSFRMIATIAGTVATAVESVVGAATPDAAFRWDAAAEQWIFNISNAGLASNRTYLYRIGLNDGTFIDFRYGVR